MEILYEQLRKVVHMHPCDCLFSTSLHTFVTDLQNLQLITMHPLKIFMALLRVV